MKAVTSRYCKEFILKGTDECAFLPLQWNVDIIQRWFFYGSKNSKRMFSGFYRGDCCTAARNCIWDCRNGDI
ncbi:hypothetical protein BW425_09430 [Bacillus pseudomycoides]|uniref:Uncharacterized protein n=1 Tax=Bacillus pseudomycoides TaxID=64104 RepID=A0A1Y3MGT2_9BACI|nr:hypothetical protein BW425_09430 [Bacillus pseudomycoides]PEK62513.1 hypothetical protein CN590_21460 [Bacillus pseudomycoides]PEL25241.1 hypothetical protein CN608_16005 [Bacillus pseudomycoides]PGE88362.1 hypothetical protein COM55_02550 [Bacillus pseudomycoides]